MSRESTNVDQHVGERMRMRRIELGISQERLATALGVTFQQVQKYERGANRVSASRLRSASQALGVEIAYFYEGLSARGEDGASERAGSGAPVLTREGLELVQAFGRIARPEARRALVVLARELAEREEAA